MVDVLVVGNGGRESVLGEQLKASEQVGKLYFMPGNAGTAALGENVVLDALNVSSVTSFVQEHNIGVVVVGPEASLVAGLGDALRATNIPIFGPSKAAAQLEGSKAFASDFMERHAIPQPTSWVTHSLEEALAVIKDKPADSYVLKAAGLAGGKGVVLPETTDHATSTLIAMFDGKYDGAGKEVVVQERLHGPEVSAFAITDGTHVVRLPNAQDHKLLEDNDQGAMTGGVGTYCPVPASILSGEQDKKVQQIIQATVDGMREEGTPYQGVLYVGLMLAEERANDPVVIEYNCRFGDPEAEVLLTVLTASGCKTGDLIIAAAKGDVSSVPVPIVTHAALAVCLSAAGYPESPVKGAVIKGLDKHYDGVTVYHAGTAQKDDQVVVSGGRVVYVTAVAESIDDAAVLAYAAIGSRGVHFDGMQYRTDIGWQARKK